MATEAKASAAALAGRELRVFVRPAAVQSVASTTRQEISEPDEFYEFTAEDYARLTANKREERFLKTRKFREAELAAHRRITKCTIRVQFPDNLVLEANFKSSDTVSEIVELLKKVLVNPEVPFYIYTTPPKQTLKNLQATMYDAGLVPGGIVYFSYVKGEDATTRYLKDEVAALVGLEDKPRSPVHEQPATQDADSPARPTSPSRPASSKAASKQTKPKWLKLSK